MTSYFSAPSDILDPALFDGDNNLKEEVRQPLIAAACYTLKNAGVSYPEEWLNIWLTGSGITYQWTDNHDLDVQMGIDHGKFVNYNPQFKGVPDYMISDRLNKYLRTFLWPKMEHATFDGKEFTVTFFWNDMVENDISVIHPYAAYNIVEDNWVIEPPRIPHDPHTLYPKTWFDTALSDEDSANRIRSGYTTQSEAIKFYAPGSPGYVTSRSSLNLLAAQAQSLYDDIHQGRRQAFSSGGKGYYDYHNFRWQQSKESGTKNILKAIINDHNKRKDEEDIALYGKPIASAQEALEDAMNFRLGRRFDT